MSDLEKENNDIESATTENETSKVDAPENEVKENSTNNEAITNSQSETGNAKKPDLSTYVFDKDKYEREYTAIVEKRDVEVRKLYLNLSIASLILAIIYGLGVLLAVPVLVLSALKMKQKVTTTVIWSVVISSITIVLGTIYFILALVL